MRRGVLPHRVRLLADGHSCYRPRRTDERKSVRGCIVGPDISVLSLGLVVKQGKAEIPGITDMVLPTRATKIGSFNLGKEDDFRKYVVCREVKSAKKEDMKPYTQA